MLHLPRLTLLPYGAATESANHLADLAFEGWLSSATPEALAKRFRCTLDGLKLLTDNDFLRVRNAFFRGIRAELVIAHELKALGYGVDLNEAQGNQASNHWDILVTIQGTPISPMKIDIKLVSRPETVSWSRFSKISTVFKSHDPSVYMLAVREHVNGIMPCRLIDVPTLRQLLIVSKYEKKWKEHRGALVADVLPTNDIHDAEVFLPNRSALAFQFKNKGQWSYDV